jgi:5-oxopent-3-ene-1,2,5-tricarboxylate decarboxylase/2-hydroxyhepta-2,4-diene-1,7-dioate isomerase
MLKQQISGRSAVYGVILNDTVSLQKIGSLDEAPYKGAPKAPVLYIKPANTRVACGTAIELPAGATTVEVAATVGLVIGRAAARLAAGEALAHIGGLVLAADLSLPHASYYRPAIKEKCFDGSLPLTSVQPLTEIGRLVLKTEIDGKVVDERPLSDLIRPPAQLLSEVSEWMTLNAGDVLLLGVLYQAPQAAAGSRVKVSAEGLGSLEFTIAEGVAA